MSIETRTTRTPAFWVYPPPPHDYPYYWPVHIGVKITSKNYKLKEFAKTLNFFILNKPLHAKHLLKLLDNMYKYEMGRVSIIED